MTESLAGKLLIASLSLVDPNFFRTVVLVCMHDEDGAMGLVLNHPLEQAPVADHLPQFADLAAPPPVVFKGGPVEPTAAIALGRFRPGADPPNRIVGRAALLDLSRPLEDYRADLESVRVFAGYAGWGAGQLDREIAEEAWFVVPALEADAFDPDAATLWRRVLQRQPGKLKLFAWAPADPRVN
ncbi:YqgE/AlgH family protein [Tepidiforma sp.]|uniref:YqgE/AlgH family protein n=1 Tax=Tepidiforma sp. TaxID=2682230 RepID=UPI00260914B1|nr:YqgE/AlgH family protein [Tepidiforma sp.]MCX7617267.1 YqgE/AlgH family protein [Tepidiforma sp.]